MHYAENNYNSRLSYKDGRKRICELLRTDFYNYSWPHINNQ